ncbi:hypothetical protein C9E82_20340 [Paracoccus siganidrum]|uniref:Uncharacterized protein n=1 Tax=Paracoccus siganidrum TaxID=1276757 RepID=A0A419A6V9_9RHOB|nr:hypothetical protein D3P05_10660 [Paracoccus siganidrum]RMC29351.1 hypothetical protein C9E82_20340 [Paracoccus siganidrum]
MAADASREYDAAMQSPEGLPVLQNRRGGEFGTGRTCVESRENGTDVPENVMLMMHEMLLSSRRGKLVEKQG